MCLKSYTYCKVVKDAIIPAASTLICSLLNYGKIFYSKTVIVLDLV